MEIVQFSFLLLFGDGSHKWRLNKHSVPLSYILEEVSVSFFVNNFEFIYLLHKFKCTVSYFFARCIIFCIAGPSDLPVIKFTHLNLLWHPQRICTWNTSNANDRFRAQHVFLLLKFHEYCRVWTEISGVGIFVLK